MDSDSDLTLYSKFKVHAEKEGGSVCAYDMLLLPFFTTVWQAKLCFTVLLSSLALAGYPAISWMKLKASGQIVI